MRPFKRTKCPPETQRQPVEIDAAPIRKIASANLSALCAQLHLRLSHEGPTIAVIGGGVRDTADDASE
jgi:hypothetical protein